MAPLARAGRGHVRRLRRAADDAPRGDVGQRSEIVPAMSALRGPFAPGSVSLRLYPHQLDQPTAVLDELQHQAALAIRSGFDGVMLSERHGGAWGQIPNPLQAAGWLLGAVPEGWVAPCPLLLPLRRTQVAAEEIAWLDARFAGRVGVGFGSRGNEADVRVVGGAFGERNHR